MSKKMVKRLIGIAGLLLLIVIGILYNTNVKKHIFVLSGDEQIQPVTGTVKVTSPFDTEVIFIDVQTGDNYAIPYITAGVSETIKLEKGKWYSVESGAGLKMSPVNVRIESVDETGVDEDMSLSINIDGVTYFGLGPAMPVEPDESVIEYMELPAGKGKIKITAFARMEEGKMIACLVDGEWYRFHSMEALASSEVHIENQDDHECATTEIPRLIMVNDELYYDSAEESTVDGRCGNMDGTIEYSMSGGTGIPRKNNSSNFGVGYGYQYGPEEGTIEVLIDDIWCVFRKCDVNEADSSISVIGGADGPTSIFVTEKIGKD